MKIRIEDILLAVGTYGFGVMNIAGLVIWHTEWARKADSGFPAFFTGAFTVAYGFMLVDWALDVAPDIRAWRRRGKDGPGE